jgi:hypothetical protein
MKRLLLFLLAITLSAQALNQVTWPALTTTGTTPLFATPGNDVHTVQIVLSGSPSGCTINLDGSLDGSHWNDISGSQTCTSNIMFHVVSRSVRFVRGDLTALSGGTSPTVTVTYLGHSSGGRQ